MHFHKKDATDVFVSENTLPAIVIIVGRRKGVSQMNSKPFVQL